MQKEYRYKNQKLVKEDISQPFGIQHVVSIYEDDVIVYKKVSYTLPSELHVPLDISSIVIESIYTSHGEFLTNSLPNKTHTSYLPIEDYKSEETLDKKLTQYIDNGKIRKAKKISDKSNRFTIEENGTPKIQDKYLVKEFSTLRDKYHSIEKSIMYNIALPELQQALSIITTYIAKKSLNIERLHQILNNLDCVSCIVPSSISLLSNFLSDPKNTDLRNLIEQLSHSIKNIESIIDIKAEKVIDYEM